MKNKGLIIVMGIIAIVLIAGGAIWDIDSDWFKDVTKGSAQEGFIGVGYTIEYADGTIKEVLPDKNFQILPLKVVDTSGKAIWRVAFSAYALVDWKGDLKTLDFGGWIVIKYGVDTIWEKSIVYEGDFPPPKNEWFFVDSIEKWGTDLGNEFPQEGIYRLDIIVDLTVDATFADGSVSSESGHADGQFTFEVKNGSAITVLSVETKASSYSLPY